MCFSFYLSILNIVQWNFHCTKCPWMWHSVSEIGFDYFDKSKVEVNTTALGHNVVMPVI